MATKTYLPTKAMQETTNAKIDALQSTATSTKSVVDTTKTALASAQESLDEANEQIAALQSQLNTMEKQAGIQYANITVRFNWDGQTYDAPTDAAVIAELLTGAKVIFREQGVDEPYEAAIDSITNFSCSFKVLVTMASRVKPSSVIVHLGSSTSAAYACTSSTFYLAGGKESTIYINSLLATGDIVEMFRAQPYVANPSASSTTRLKQGDSYLGTRITTGTGETKGTKTYFGHWSQGQAEWVDESMTKISLWNVPKNSDGTAGTPVERVITEAASTENWVSLDDRLNCIKNIKIGTLSYTGGGVTVGDNKIVRFDQLWVKTTRETINMPIDVNGDGVLVENMVDCVIKWYANSNVDGTYRLHTLFEKYARQSDGTYTTTECAHGYIARYPIGNVVSATFDGATKSVPQWKSGNGNQYVPGTRAFTLECCRWLNQCTATLSFDGEPDVTIAADTTNRTWGVAGTAEISFLQWMAYLYFGVNVQGATSTTDFSLNTFPGICSGSVSATTNGATDFIVNVGKMNGAIDTSSPYNSIVFLGVEDALWSSTGWYWEDLTYCSRRVITSDANGTVTKDVEEVVLLFAQDTADVEPGTEDIADETLTDENDNLSYEAQLKAQGYRETTFAGGTSWYRAGTDTTAPMRDGFLPASVQDQSNLNIGAYDAYWRTAATSFSFSTSVTYNNGDYVRYNNKLYRCIVASHKGNWADADFELCTSLTVRRRTYQLAALGISRINGSNLGAFPLNANNRLLVVNGYAWRARPLLRVA